MIEERLKNMRTRSALVIVDVQNDFADPDGALYVPGGEGVIEPLNRWIEDVGMWTVATQDWHPARHCSFIPQGGKFPPHCVAGTRGSNLCDGLVHPISKLRKAILRDEESLSAFSESAMMSNDSPEAGLTLLEVLRTNEITHLYIGGLATEYCVGETVRDALKLDFNVSLILDAIRPIDEEYGFDALQMLWGMGMNPQFGSIEFIHTNDFYEGGI